jgi:hypothetical protein
VDEASAEIKNGHHPAHPIPNAIRTQGVFDPHGNGLTAMIDAPASSSRGLRRRPVVQQLSYAR